MSGMCCAGGFPGGRRVVLLLALVAASGCAMSPDEAGGGIMRFGGDLLGTGGELRVTDSVAADAMIVGGDVGFSGSTGGDLIVAGGNLSLDGRIGGSLRAAGGNITVASTVTRNATVAGGDVSVEAASVIGGNAYLAGGTVVVNGRIEGALNAGAGKVTLSGPIGGDVRVEAGELTITSGAVIAGTLRYRVPSERLTIDPGARIIGERIAIPPRPEFPFAEIFGIVFAAGFLLAGSVLVLLFPGTMRLASNAVRDKPALSGALGLLVLVGLPLALVLIAITVLGIPLMLIGAVLYCIALYLARAITAVWLGRLILRDRPSPSRERLLASFLIGGLIVAIGGFIPVVGWLFSAVVTIVGLGAFAIAIRSAQEPNPAPV